MLMRPAGQTPRAMGRRKEEPMWPVFYVSSLRLEEWEGVQLRCEERCREFVRRE
jgi:hypothetical protein